MPRTMITVGFSEQPEDEAEDGSLEEEGDEETFGSALPDEAMLID